MNAQRRKIISGNARQNSLICFAVGRQSCERDVIRKQVAKGICLPADVLIVGVGKSLKFGHAWLFHSQNCELFRMWHRQWAEQHAIDYAKDSGIDGHSRPKATTAIS